MEFLPIIKVIPVFNLNDKKIDELFNRAMSNPSGQMRSDYYKVINRLIFEHYAVVPLQYGSTKNYFVRDSFIMPSLDVSGTLRIKNISVSK